MRILYEELELEAGERKLKTEGHGEAFVRQPRPFKSFSATESVALALSIIPTTHDPVTLVTARLTPRVNETLCDGSHIPQLYIKGLH